MLEALEKDLCLTVDMRDRKEIIEMFSLAKSIQLPVVSENKVMGILDLFVFLHSITTNIPELMEKDIVVAGINKGIFTFQNSKQHILPFSDENGNYSGFVNKLFQKCYLPNKEYMQVIKSGSVIQSDGVMTEDIDYENIEESFDALFESNYDGIYITVNEGRTISFNNNGLYTQNIKSVDLIDGNGDMNIDFDNKHTENVVSIMQNIQKRNEISISNKKVTDGGIIRVIGNVDNYDKMKKDLIETSKIAEKYYNELEFLRWQQSRPIEIVAESTEMKKIINMAVKISKVDSTVLITGQSGTGKEVLSKIIHNDSNRKDGPLIKIDCGSIPENLIEAELFGYVQGSFTGAEKGGKPGLIELADKGTLFLDEIGELPLHLQTRLLRFLQDREILRIGGKESIPVDIRVIAATNKNLEKMIKEKKFRKDLYYRLNIVPMRIPSLKERREDIRPLIEKNLQRFNKKYNLNIKMNPDVMKALFDYEWPGNVRELENLIEYLAVTSTSGLITIDELPEKFVEKKNRSMYLSNGGSNDIDSLKDAVEEFEKRILRDTIKKAKNIEGMAGLLGLDRSTVSRKLKKYDIKPEFKLGII
jgi:transcriptional regulator with PAS, ATPase and Fis domain